MFINRKFKEAKAVGVETVVASGPNAGIYYYQQRARGSRVINNDQDIIIIGMGGQYV